MMGWACGFDGGVHAEFGRGNIPDIRKERKGAWMLMKLAWAAMCFLLLLPSKCFDV